MHKFIVARRARARVELQSGHAHNAHARLVAGAKAYTYIHIYIYIHNYKCIRRYTHINLCARVRIHVYPTPVRNLVVTVLDQELARFKAMLRQCKQLRRVRIELTTLGL